jgi:hypothetical protein
MNETTFRSDAMNSVAIREGAVLKNPAIRSPNPEL